MSLILFSWKEKYLKHLLEFQIFCSDGGKARLMEAADRTLFLLLSV